MERDLIESAQKEERSFPTIEELDAMVEEGKMEKIGDAYRTVPSTDPEIIEARRRSSIQFRNEYNARFIKLQDEQSSEQRRIAKENGLHELRLY